MTPAAQNLIKVRLRLRAVREKAQMQLLSDRALQKQTVEHKLMGLGAGRQFDNFLRCGNEEMFCTCRKCGKVEKFYYACNRKWCPSCVVKLSLARAKIIRAWSEHIAQPKHLVLTMRNFPVLTGSRVKAFGAALRKLRAHDSWSQVRGGCASIEVTNEGNGWHLHAHLLLDVRWLDMPSISVEWGKLVGQSFGIVKIKDVRGEEFLQEVTKYCVKGSELASWPAEHIFEFVLAIKGRRFFFPFGSLRKEMKNIKRELALAAGGGKACECGSTEFLYQTEADMVLDEIAASRGFHRKRK